ncbi:hypothetical protein BDF14DRAFT_1994105 [Spinellus fusiger]|nr:hypothetical protein BDF14DRAFT_1994105 [Spinellus fusiger]
MITYFILNKSGDIIYPLSPEDNVSPQESKLRFLPLLLIKDLIKANFHDQIQYIKSGKRTVAFWEKHNLFYVAWTKNKALPVSLLDHHLGMLDCFLQFNYGPQWHTQLQGPTLSRPHRTSLPSLSSDTVAECLSQLPFLTKHPSAKNILCCVEQLQVHEDLRNRLRDCLENACCSLQSSPKPSSTLASFFTPPKRTFSAVRYYQQHQHQQQHSSQDCSMCDTHHSMRHWTHAFLFAKDKIVSRCYSSQEHPNVPEHLLMFLQLLVTQYLAESEKEKAYSNPMDASTHSQMDTSSQPMDRPFSLESSFDKMSVAESPSTTSSTRLGSSSVSEPHIQPSSVFISTSTPFKLRRKSSFVTYVSYSDAVPSVSWSSPPPLVYNHLLSHLPHPQELLLHKEPPQGTDWSRDPPSELPRNATAKQRHFSASEDYMVRALSSSFPTDTLYKYFSQSPGTSPKSQSCTHSLAEPTTTKESVKSMLGTFLYGDKESLQDPDLQGMLLWRWVLRGDALSPCSIYVTSVAEGVCAVVISKEEEKSLAPTARQNRSMEEAYYEHLRAFRSTLQEDLRDFSSFLQTKEATHFTILSFVATYPGLVHFIYLQEDRMMAPQLTDLSQLQAITLQMPSLWQWPTLAHLKKLSRQMVCVGLACREDERELQLQPVESHRFNCLYQCNGHGELFGLYFGHVDTTDTWTMHGHLLQDLSQRMT